MDAVAEARRPPPPQLGRLAQRAVARARDVAEHAVEAQVRVLRARRARRAERRRQLRAVVVGHEERRRVQPLALVRQEVAPPVLGVVGDHEAARGGGGVDHRRRDPLDELLRLRPRARAHVEHAVARRDAEEQRRHHRPPPAANVAASASAISQRWKAPSVAFDASSSAAAGAASSAAAAAPPSPSAAAAASAASSPVRRRHPVPSSSAAAAAPSRATPLPRSTARETLSAASRRVPADRLGGGTRAADLGAPINRRIHAPSTRGGAAPGSSAWPMMRKAMPSSQQAPP